MLLFTQALVNLLIKPNDISITVKPLQERFNRTAFRLFFPTFKMNDIQLSAIINKNPLTVDDILRVQQFCLQNVRSGELYDLQNDAKLRAVTSSTTYEEFKDIVDAAHLTPLSKFDKKNAKTKTRLWNPLTKE